MQNNMDSRVYAGFFVRLSAYLIDWLIVSAALLFVRIPVWIANLGGCADLILKDFIFEYSVYDIILYLLKVVYFVLLTYFTGSTLGKKLLQIQVVSTEERKPTFFEIVFRESVGKFLSALIIYIGYFMIGVDKKKRGFHDILSDTYVVYNHRKTITVPAPVTYNTVPYPMQNQQLPPYQAGADGQFVSQNTAPLKPGEAEQSELLNTAPLKPSEAEQSELLNMAPLKPGEVEQSELQNMAFLKPGEMEQMEDTRLSNQGDK